MNAVQAGQVKTLFVGHPTYLAPGLCQRLPLLHGHQGGQVFLVLNQQIVPEEKREDQSTKATISTPEASADASPKF